MAAGDDVSTPNRCFRVAALAATEASVRSIFLGISPIGKDASLREIPERPNGLHRFPSNLRNNGAVAVGASQAWHRAIADTFGELPTGLLREDAVIPFRASLIGDVLVDNTVSVLYRLNSNFLSRGDFRKPSKKALLKARSGELGEIVHIEKDIELAVWLGFVDEVEARSISPKIKQMKNTARVSVALLDRGRISRLFAAVKLTLRIGDVGNICGNWRFRVALSKLAFC